MTTIILKVKQDTIQYNMVKDAFYEQRKNSSNLDMPRFEKILGIIDYCLDLDIYKYEDDLYVIMEIQKDNEEKFIKTKNKSFTIISYENFIEEIKKNFEYVEYAPLGTRMFHRKLLSTVSRSLSRINENKGKKSLIL